MSCAKEKWQDCRDESDRDDAVSLLNLERLTNTELVLNYLFTTTCKSVQL